MKKEKFKEYSSIKQISNKSLLCQAEYLVPKEEKWCATEKVHGANILLYYDEEGFDYGNRSSFIRGSFYNSHNVLPKYEDNIKQIYEKYKKPIIIYGEIYGGLWNNETLELRVQKGIQYSKYINVVFFDLKIDDKFIAYKEAIEIFKEFKIPYLEPLKIGTLEEVLEYPNDFDSMIPLLNGLPIVENNTCEGTVIKPFEGDYTTNGGSRVIIKNKNKKFSEKGKKIKIKLKELSQEANELISNLSSYITENRFDAVFSKEQYTKKDFGIFLGRFVKDLLNDAKDDKIDIKSVSNEEKSRITKIINKKSVELIKDLFFDTFKERE